MVKLVFKEEKNSKIKSEICKKILRSLPTWFGQEKPLKDYVKGVGKKFFIAVYDKEIPIAFISIKEHNKYTDEIYVMGVLKKYHGKGIGTKLVGIASKHSKKKGKQYLTVKTLSASHPDKYYRNTRKFYLFVGFIPLEEFQTLWDKNNPCLFMVKRL